MHLQAQLYSRHRTAIVVASRLARTLLLHHIMTLDVRSIRTDNLDGGFACLRRMLMLTNVYANWINTFGTRLPVRLAVPMQALLQLLFLPSASHLATGAAPARMPLFYYHRTHLIPYPLPAMAFSRHGWVWGRERTDGQNISCPARQHALGELPLQVARPVCGACAAQLLTGSLPPSLSPPLPVRAQASWHMPPASRLHKLRTTR